MKKVLMLVCILAVLCVAASDYVLRTDNFGWKYLGEITTVEAASPAVGERDYTNLVANHTNSIIKTLDPYRYNGAVLRFVVDDDGDDTVIDLFASKGQDYFTLIATLTLKGGLQVGPSTNGADAEADVFVDTITITNENWGSDISVVDSGNDRIATVWLDLNGYDTLAFIPTTLDDQTRVWITGY